MKLTKNKYMNYELAKKLKDAGFPQEMKFGDILLFEDKEWIHTGGGHLESDGKKEGFYAEKCGNCCVEAGIYDSKSLVRNIYDEEGIKIPTLSELIEACGDKFGWLKRLEVFNVTWEAACNIMPGKIFLEPTPEEAVANLWLELNKK